MAKSKLARSQSAHKTLACVYADRYGRDARIKEEYHKKVFAEQANKRILSRSKKREIYASVEKKHPRDTFWLDKNGRDIRDDFSRDSRGRIKGSYTVDGFFEPD